MATPEVPTADEQNARVDSASRDLRPSRITQWSAFGTAVIGLSTLAGWWWANDWLIAGFGLGVPMNPVTALMMVFAAIALFDLSLVSSPRWWHRVSLAGAAGILIIGSLRLAELIFGWDLQVDQLLSPQALAADAPSRMSANVAFSLMAFGGGLLLIRSRHDGWRLTARSLVAVGSIAAAVTVVAFVVRVFSPNASWSTKPLPINTAAALMFVAIGTVALRDRVTREAAEHSRVIRQRVNVALTVAVAILVMTSGVSIWSTMYGRQVVVQGRSSDVRRTSFSALIASVQSAESGQRGYLLTHDTAFAVPYRAGADSVPAQLKRIETALASDSTQATRFLHLKGLIQRKLRDLDRSITLERSGQRDSAIATIRLNDGDSLMTQIRAEARLIASAEDSTVSSGDARSLIADRVSMMTTLIATCLAIAFLVFAGRAINVDMRKRASAEEAVRNSEQRLSQVIELVPAALFLKDPDTLRYVTVNKAAQRLMGYTEDEIRGNRSTDLFEGEAAKATIAQDRAVLASHDVLDIPEETVITRHLGVRTLRTQKVAVRDAHGRPMFLLGISEDITERKQSELAVREAMEVAETANRTKSDFLAKMSHELRTPLNSIIGFSEILEDQSAGPLTEKQQRYVGNVLTSGRNLLELINDILDLSRIEAGRMELTVDEIEVPRAVEQVRTIVTSLADRKQLTIRTSIDESAQRIFADQTRFKQILFNLIGNAIKFTPDGGSIDITAAPCPHPDADGKRWVEFAVKDTGVGISPADQQRMFAEFVQVGAQGSRAQQGTGLGLAITRMLVQLHGGRLSAESEVGQGSTFRFTMPAFVEECEKADTIFPASDIPPIKGEGPLVLVVENDEHAQVLITHYLNEAGYSVAVASNGQEALRFAQTSRPDAITLDVMLPDQDGMVVLALLKSDPATRSIPVVIVSVTARRELGFSLGASEWLVKPVDRPTLVEAIRSTLGSSDASYQRKVLIVDDEAAAREYLIELLTPLGFDIVVATGGREGIALAETERPDLMILDLMMPDVDGFQVIEALRTTQQATPFPVLILTSRELSTADRALLAARVQAVVSKGGRDELLAELEALCPVPTRAEL